MQKLLFVSHSSSDAENVKALVRLIEDCFVGVNEPNIYCTSVEKYNKLTFGKHAGTELPEGISGSLVICLLTARSLSSSWVMFELGAASALSSRVIPLLHGPTHKELPVALAGTNAAYFESESDLYRVMEDISKELDWVLESPNTMRVAMEHFREGINVIKSVPAQRLVQRKDIYELLPWNEVFEKAANEVYIWGWSGESAVNNRTRNLIQSFLKRGRKLKVLVLNEKNSATASAFLSLGPVCSWPESSVKTDISKGRQTLLDLKQALSQDERRNFYCKETSWNMTWSGVAIDPDEDNGLLQIENYLYNYRDFVGNEDHLKFRPNILLTRESPLYQPYRYSLQKLWESGEEFGF